MKSLLHKLTAAGLATILALLLTGGGAVLAAASVPHCGGGTQTHDCCAVAVGGAIVGAERVAPLPGVTAALPAPPLVLLAVAPREYLRQTWPVIKQPPPRSRYQVWQL